MESIGDNKVRLHETAHGRLGYVQEFKALIHEHPGIIKTAFELMQRAEDGYNPPNVRVGRGELQWDAEQTQFYVIKMDGKDVHPQTFSSFVWGRGVILVPGEAIMDEVTGLEVTTLAKTKREFRKGLWGMGQVGRIDQSTYFKIQLGDKAFFIKKSVATDNLGYKEFRNSTEATTTLRGIENLSIVQAQLGYDDGHQSWFVSKWEDLESAGFFPLDTWVGAVPNDYGQYPPRYNQDKYFVQMREILKKGEAIKEEIKKKLADKGLEIHDLDSNLFYNPVTGKYFLLDITTGPSGKGIGQPDYF